ncbi:hypothetical protein Cus16_1072 [Curtobacterium sp. ER1/6]|nr:hypothetical protein Cus16_1072 [Curtobacterium sp. ER1/6]
MPDLVEEHAGRRPGAPPPRDLAVAAVDEHLQLSEHEGEQRPPDPRDQQCGGDAPADQDHETGHLVRRDPRLQQQPGQVRGDVTQVQRRRPVLRVRARADLVRLGDRAELRDRGGPGAAAAGDVVGQGQVTVPCAWSARRSG